MLIKHHLFGVENKIKNAIELLRQFEPPEGYYLAFSGGKDSVVIKALADMAGVKYDAHYNLTTTKSNTANFTTKDLSDWDVSAAPWQAYQGDFMSSSAGQNITRHIFEPLTVCCRPSGNPEKKQPGKQPKT